MEELVFYYGAGVTTAYQVGGIQTALSSEFPDLEGHHPTEAYHTDSWGLATLLCPTGLLARANVYRNGLDMRYTRVYGDQKLGEILKSQGYVQKDFEWTALKTVYLSGNRYLCPYIDTVKPQEVYVTLGNGRLTIIPKTYAESLKNTVRKYAVVGSMGYVEL